MPRYVVRLTFERYVRTPMYGPFAFVIQYATYDIPFSRDQATIKTGKEALALAEKYAKQCIEEATNVTISKLTTAGNGTGRRIKTSERVFMDEYRFPDFPFTINRT